MISEWMKVMLEEISRKKSEAEQARAEELMRREDSERARRAAARVAAARVLAAAKQQGRGPQSGCDTVRTCA